MSPKAEAVFIFISLFISIWFILWLLLSLDVSPKKEAMSQKHRRALDRLDRQIEILEARIAQISSAHPQYNSIKQELSDWRRLRQVLVERFLV